MKKNAPGANQRTFDSFDSILPRLPNGELDRSEEAIDKFEDLIFWCDGTNLSPADEKAATAYYTLRRNNWLPDDWDKDYPEPRLWEYTDCYTKRLEVHRSKERERLVKAEQSKPQSPPLELPPTSTSNASDPEFWENMLQLAEQFQYEKQPLHQRQASLRAIAYDAGVSLDHRQVKWLDKQGERAAHNLKDGYDPTEAISIPVTKWLWDDIVLLGCVNLLIAREKVGKTSLIVYLLRCWLNRSGAMGIAMAQPPERPAILIAGTDQGKADWFWYLEAAGLATKKLTDPEHAEFQLAPEIVKLWTQDAPIFLDEEGIANLGQWVAKHPGALLICDSLSTLIGPLGLKENDADFAEPLRALSRAMEQHNVTTIVLHHSGKGNEGERGSTASRGSTAITAAVSRIIQLAWVDDKNKTDQRIALTTEGRRAKAVGLVIEQVEACSWVLVGDLDEIAQEKARQKAEENLTERQEAALAEVREAWEQDHHEMEAAWLVERLPVEYTGRDKARKARENLDQLFRKSLVDKRTVGAAGARRNLYRPVGADLAEVKLRSPVCPKDPPQSPQSPNPSNDGLVSKNTTPISPHQSSAEGAEGVTETQGVIAFAGGHRTSGGASRPGGDDPHWGARPTTNGKEVG